MPQLHRDDYSVINRLWGAYFPEEARPGDLDPRLEAIDELRNFLSEAGSKLLLGCELSTAAAISFSAERFARLCPMRDFDAELTSNPKVVLACLGLALCLVRKAKCPGLASSTRILARMMRLEPVTDFSALKSDLVGRLVTLVGNVTRVGNIAPLVLSADFECSKCGCIMPSRFTDGMYNPPKACIGDKCQARTFKLLKETATMADFQTIKLQEIENDSAEAGRIPRSVQVELLEDLVDSCIPGDQVTLTGVVRSTNAELAQGRMNKRARTSGIFVIYIEANSILNTRERKTEEDQQQQQQQHPSKDAVHFTETDLLCIREVAENHKPFHLLTHSLCPGIFGHDVVKAGLILGLLGGTARQTDIPVRSDIHVLVVGDPGLGKSQMLQAVSKVAPRSVFVCGNTSSTSGMTVTISKNKGGGGGDSGLEAGALVLADQGVCCVDEFDKMTCDPHALLEAMEQQQISIAKAGVVASLSARCSVIAAANAMGGHYNRGKTVGENLKMSSALLSRFDLVFILLDSPDKGHDSRIASHVMATHAQAGTTQLTGHSTTQLQGQSQAPLASLTGSFSEGPSTLSQRLRASASAYCSDPLPPALMRKYIAYAKRYVKPRLTLGASRVLQTLYLTMRKEAAGGRSMPITSRQLESLIRLSQARARADLRDVVTEADAGDVVDMMQESLLEAFTNELGCMDFTQTGSNASLPKKVKAFVAAMNKETLTKGSALFREQELLDLANRLALAIPDFHGFIEVLRAECYLLKKGPKLYQAQTT